MDVAPGRLARLWLPVILLTAILRRRTSPPARRGLLVALGALWVTTYARYRRRGIEATAHEWDQLRTATPEAYSRHYNENVPTVEEELDLWSDYHGHRHDMRYRLVGDAALAHLPTGGTVVDIGCGSALVADQLAGSDAHYVGIDFGGHHITSAAKRHRDSDATLRTSFVRGEGERLPFAAATVDVVVFTEVIEHLVRPELAVWEIARVLRPGGVLVMTTNNASEMPLRFPLSDPLAFVEKAIGFTRDQVISHRPWVWPHPVSTALYGADAPPIWLPHTWHKQAETRRMFAAAGLETISATTFEFPPPQSASARWLDGRGDAGRVLVDRFEAVCRATPGVSRLGCHLMMIATRVPGGLSSRPAGIWPGPFSD